jgi:hypothetical protein
MANHPKNTQDGSVAPSSLTSSEFLGAVESAVRENPLSAALIGMGALWLFTGGNTTPIFGTGSHQSDFRSPRSAIETTGHAVRSVAGAVGSSLSAVAGSVADTVHNASSHVNETVHGLGDAAAKAAHDTAVATHGLASGTASHAASHYLHDSGGKMGSALQREISHVFHEQPFILGLLGLAIGAGIASSLPTTEAEQQVMGETSGLVEERVSSATAKFKDLANTAIEEAKAQV